MKNVSIIGFLIIGLIFQNCKNNKTHPAVLNNDTPGTTKAVDTLETKADTISTKWIVPTNFKKMKNPTYATNENLVIGKALYTKHCKSCHGISGAGDGPNAAEFDSNIGDFTSKEFQAQTDGTIYYKSYVGQHDMPNYEKKIPGTNNMWLIVNHLKTLEKQE
jgi:mono/diheme cytochrome c family protein